MKKYKICIVIKNKMDKTIIVKENKIYKHKKYGKYIKKQKKYYVHVKFNIYLIGDIVKIIESRPISKTKRWIIYKK